jgi:hypothetical protein
MMKSDLNLQTRAHDYGNPESAKKDKELPEPSNSLHIEKPVVDPMPHIPKGVLKWTSHNPNARVAQNYSIVEDLAQTPCAMSALEVLQSFPSQQMHCCLL